MNIEVRPKSKLKIFLSNLHDKSEDILFSIVQKLPKSLIPSSIMTWFENYLDKRSRELQHEILRQQWRQVYLEKAMEEIQSTQQVEKAQSGE